MGKTPAFAWANGPTPFDLELDWAFVRTLLNEADAAKWAGYGNGIHHASIWDRNLGPVLRMTELGFIKIVSESKKEIPTCGTVHYFGVQILDPGVAVLRDLNETWQRLYEAWGHAPIS